ncbi:MAG: glycoside hydrolase family 9 protein, partial [Chitinispirillaceae bacterium]|nr:glycoside hydrolase family 9 protein [Chitinispirillaceae bacterium]
LNTLASPILTTLKNSAYSISMKSSDFVWGSNGVAANQGMAFAIAYLATGKEDFRNAALDMLDYLIGRNPTGYCFVTGYGDKSPMFIHHRPSAADSIKEPVPGFLVGGPNPALQDTTSCGGNYYPSKLPALAYIDSVCSYASNEIAINWNAPFVFLVGAIEAIYGRSSAEIKIGGNRRYKEIGLNIICKGNILHFNFSSKESKNIFINDIRGRLLWKKCNFTEESLRIIPKWKTQTLIIMVRNNRNDKILAKKILFGD